MPTYPSPPASFIDTFDNPVSNQASPHFKQIDGGVTQASINGLANVVTQSRPVRAIAKSTVEYIAWRNFFNGLKGAPFSWQGVNWVIESKEWTPVGYGVWVLSMSIKRWH